jgi:hypothetical protein
MFLDTRGTEFFRIFTKKNQKLNNLNYLLINIITKCHVSQLKKQSVSFVHSCANNSESYSKNNSLACLAEIAR